MRWAWLLLWASTASATPPDARPPDAVEADRLAARAEVADLERRMHSLEEQSASRRGMLAKRLRALYKMTEGGYLRLLVSGDAQSREDDALRDASVRRLLRRDLAELAAVRDEARQLEHDQARRQAALAEALRLTEPTTSDDTVFGRRRGSLTRPLPGFVAFGFGAYHPVGSDGKEGPVELSRRGVEIRSVAGQAVHASAPGVVRWVGPVPGMDLGVIVDHGEGYSTVTARLRSAPVVVGNIIPDGVRIGEAAGTTVYFELTQAGTPLNPLAWLQPPAPLNPAAPKPAVGAEALR